METQNPSDSLYYIWFAVLLAALLIIFVARLKFNRMYERRQERRRLLAYSKVKLNPNEDGLSRSLKVRRLNSIKP